MAFSCPECGTAAPSTAVRADYGARLVCSVECLTKWAKEKELAGGSVTWMTPRLVLVRLCWCRIW